MATDIGRPNRKWSPSVFQWNALQEFYASDELDPICTGSDRHYKFASWVLTNEQRVHERSQELYIRAAEKIAELERQKAHLDIRIKNIWAGLE